MAKDISTSTPDDLDCTEARRVVHTMRKFNHWEAGLLRGGSGDPEKPTKGALGRQDHQRPAIAQKHSAEGPTHEFKQMATLLLLITRM